MPTDSASACLVRLQEMDLALAEMEGELPDDVRSLGRDARRRVAGWLRRIAEGEIDLGALDRDLAAISGLMDTLTERLLFAPWDDGPDSLPS